MSIEFTASPMRRSSGPHLKTYGSLLVMVIAGPVGDVLLSKGMRHIAAPTDWTAVAMAGAAARVFSSVPFGLASGASSPT